MPTLEAAAQLVDAFIAQPLIHAGARRGGAVASGCCRTRSTFTAYATTLTSFPAAHAVAETTEDMKALITGALGATDAPAAFLLPTRQSDSLQWALAAGLPVVKPMTYMSIGEYREPNGAWIPSVLY